VTLTEVPVDIFPTRYKCNTLRKVATLFIGWENYSYLYSSEPQYYFGNEIVFKYVLFSQIRTIGFDRQHLHLHKKADDMISEPLLTFSRSTRVSTTRAGHRPTVVAAVAVPQNIEFGDRAGLRLLRASSGDDYRVLCWYRRVIGKREPVCYRRARAEFQDCVPDIGSANAASETNTICQTKSKLLHLIRFRHFCSGSLALASLVPAFPQRSPPRLLPAAACGGLKSAPDHRTRRALLHLSYSSASPRGRAMLV